MTFNLPNTIDRVLWGATSAGYISAGLPNITGQSNVWGSDSESGALKTTIVTTVGLGNNVYRVVGNIRLDASKSNAIYGASDTVQPPALKCLMCIKY